MLIGGMFLLPEVLFNGSANGCCARLAIMPGVPAAQRSGAGHAGPTPCQSGHCIPWPVGRCS
jgi:hypothetical protein